MSFSSTFSDIFHLRHSLSAFIPDSLQNFPQQHISYHRDLEIPSFVANDD